MNTKMVATAADVIARAMGQGRILPAALAVALDSAQLLQSPETAAELEKLQARVEELVAQRDDLLVESVTAPDTDDLQRELRYYKDKSAELEARLAEYERPADEDPIAYALTDQAPLTVFRASHDSIVMGLYTTAAEARKHCETEMRRDLPTVALDWIEDEEDDVAELVASVGEDERVTGYVVEALEVAAAYDEEADE